MKAPRFAIIGCGLIGAKRFASLPPGAVTVVYDVDRERAERLAAGCADCRQQRSAGQQEAGAASAALTPAHGSGSALFR